MTTSIRNPRDQIIGVLILALGGFLIGLAPIGLRYAVNDGLGPQTTAFWRYALAVPLFMLFFAVRGRKPARPNLAVIAAGTFFALDIGLWHLALTMTSVANATFIVNLGNIGTGFLVWLVLKDRPSIFWGIAVAMAVFGAWLLSSGGAAAGGETGLRGDMIAVVAAVFVSFYMLFAAIARRTIDALSVIFWATVTEAIVALGMAFTFGENPIPPNLSSLGPPLFLSVFAQIGGQSCIIYGIGKAPPSIAGVMVLVQPVTAAIISWPLFGEEMALIQLFGASIILTALLVAQFRWPARRGSETE